MSRKNTQKWSVSEWLLRILIGIGGLTFLATFVYAVEKGYTLNFNSWDNDLLTWRILILAFIATALTGLIIYKQLKRQSSQLELQQTALKLQSKQLELTQREQDLQTRSGIVVSLETDEEKLNSTYLDGKGIEVIFFIVNLSRYVELFVFEIMLFVEDGNSYMPVRLKQYSDFRKFNFGEPILFGPYNTLRGHFNIPEGFENIDKIEILQENFYLVAHYAQFTFDNKSVDKNTEQIYCLRFEKNEDEYRVVYVFDPPEEIQKLLSPIPS